MSTNTSYTVADAELMRSAIQRVATGPELSKNLSREEARSVMHALLDGSADPVQAGVFLIGLRMKRETEDEIKGVMDALQDQTAVVHATVDEVVAIADPYNGFNRTLQGSLFVLPVLAACGISAYSHGVELGGPKFGVTHHTIIRALGGDPLRSTETVANRIADPDIGWGYLDQRNICSGLHALNDLRARIVKRPVLSTTEVLVFPIKGARKTHLVTGYVHKPYRDTYCMLARHVAYDSLLLVRGTEGGVIPSFRAPAHIVRYNEHVNYEELDLDLAPMDLVRVYRAQDIPDTLPLASKETDPVGMKWDINALSALCAEQGREALSGKSGALLDAAVLGAAMVMWHTGKEQDLKVAADKARAVIASGEAMRRLEAGL
ncbi:MAG: anthranilate phosphoribosyltransferase [Granulosicoccaceae bacterium]